MFDLFELPDDIQERIIQKDYNIDKVMDNIDIAINMMEFKINFFEENIDIFNDMKDIFKNNSSHTQLRNKIVRYDNNLDYVAYKYEILSDDFINTLFDCMDEIDDFNDCID